MKLIILVDKLRLATKPFHFWHLIPFSESCHSDNVDWASDRAEKGLPIIPTLNWKFTENQTDSSVYF